MSLIYLDNSATTMCYPEVAALMTKLLCEDYGNPSSMHAMGFHAERALRTAREQIARTLKCREGEILFTSGGTESDNLALFGAARAYGRTGRHIITTSVEHPAVSEAAAALEREGFEVTYLPVDEAGIVRLSDVEAALRDDTILVSVMQVNNEIGSVQPVEEIGQLVKRRSDKILFHVDAVQGYGKVPLSLSAAKIDLMSVSGHKIHGPKGAGFLYVRKGVRLIPLLYGGGHQGGLRSGTENVAGYAGLGLAAEMVFSGMEEKTSRMRMLTKRLRDGVCAGLDDGTMPGEVLASAPDDEKVKAPHILPLTVRGVRAEVLLHALEDHDICVSAGSACSTHHVQTSPVLKAIGLSEEDAASTVRLSLSEFTTEEEIDAAVGTLCEVVPALRRFQRM